VTLVEATEIFDMLLGRGAVEFVATAAPATFRLPGRLGRSRLETGLSERVASGSEAAIFGTSFCNNWRLASVRSAIWFTET
jgi:hypothetical protein